MLTVLPCESAASAAVYSLAERVAQRPERFMGWTMLESDGRQYLGLFVGSGEGGRANALRWSAFELATVAEGSFVMPADWVTTVPDRATRALAVEEAVVAARR